MFKRYLTGNGPEDFEKSYKIRAAAGLAVAVLGMIPLILSTLFESSFPIFLSDAASVDFIRGFYRGTGLGLAAAGIITCIQNFRYLKNKELFKKKSVEESDERNRLIGLRCWALAGYTMFLFLYLAMLAAGLYSVTVLKVLLAVTAAFAFLLLVYRIMLQRLL
ncbi:hypothetical protein [Porcincola intestinalis]|uniref:hypothetical protein n=1 Tax=Porcincola intestinalis TaxID=2606632 RepID=UPI002A7F8E55|nr:hypothetical protein [Porcincola intestinalis]MCI7796235.1 hypothetical protein [Lachnospiraceae bacterium]MDY4204585.1 hypothetical protein [Porcincola intestinalis]